MRGAAAGVTLATLTAVIWGGQFVVGKSALERVDAFPLTTIRYALAVVVLLALLAVVEGRRALALEGRGLRLFVPATGRSPSSLPAPRSRSARSQRTTSC
jgi:drug/metabolite transporter (DMT)-like permease